MRRWRVLLALLLAIPPAGIGLFAIQFQVANLADPCHAYAGETPKPCRTQSTTDISRPGARTILVLVGGGLLAGAALGVVAVALALRGLGVLAAALLVAASALSVVVVVVLPCAVGLAALAWAGKAQAAGPS